MRTITAAARLVALVLTFGTANAEEQDHAEEAPAATASLPVAKDYCSSFVDAAAERRLVRLNDALNETKKQLTEKIKELEDRSAKLQSLLDERKSMQKKVSESLLKIYLEVEPDAAAQQLSKLDLSTAAEILVRMNAKRSGEILTLIEPKRAASLVAILTLQTKTMKEEGP